MGLVKEQPMTFTVHSAAFDDVQYSRFQAPSADFRWTFDIAEHLNTYLPQTPHLNIYQELRRSTPEPD